MARISGVDIPREKRLVISLTYIFGIGNTTAQKMCKELDLNPDTRVRNLTDSEVNKIRMYIEQNLTVEETLVEGSYDKYVRLNIERAIELNMIQC